MKQVLSEQRRNEAHLFRQQREMNDALKKSFKEEVHKEKRSKSQLIREQEALSNVRKVEYQLNKTKIFKSNYHDETTFHENQTQRKAAEVRDLRKIEQELMMRVKHVHRIELDTEQQLKEAMRLPVHPRTDKYFFPVKRGLSTTRNSTPGSRIFEERSLTSKRGQDLQQSIVSIVEGERLIKDYMKETWGGLEEEDSVSRQETRSQQMSFHEPSNIEKLTKSREYSVDISTSYERNSSGRVEFRSRDGLHEQRTKELKKIYANKRLKQNINKSMVEYDGLGRTERQA